MPDQFSERLSLLSEPAINPLLKGIQRGIEKESLRISPSGKLAQTAHPEGLGSPLTHPAITTDFSEALLELITPVTTDIQGNLDLLNDVHRFVYSQLKDEQLWSASMPCVMEGDDNIPVARYGSSNVAQMKTAYRFGLGNRYGRLMQTIAGIHYNFSLPDNLWDALQAQDMDRRPRQDYVTDAYFKLIRNFRRTSWLLVYLYGASPAVCKSFLKGREHQLQAFDAGSLHLPYATALRMGDLGYQSNAQQTLNICYNSLDNYTETLRKAITESHPDYESIGVKVDDQYQQLSTALLQIENEFYSPIRPKRVTRSGETPLGALRNQGVEYIEVRCIDVNPYLPLGIDADQIRFIDCFLLYCLFERSPLCDDDDRQRINSNFDNVVNRGRDPGLLLETSKGSTGLANWGYQLMDGIEKIAAQLDRAHGGTDYSRVCQQQKAKLADPQLTPSAKILADMSAQGKPFFLLAMDLTRQHEQYFRGKPLPTAQQKKFIEQAKHSFEKQHAIEKADSISFDRYLEQYYRQYQQL